MTKQEFIRKHNLSDSDFENLKRYEEVRKSGKMNMFEYLSLMGTHEMNGGSKLASWILSDNNYAEFKEVI